MILSDVSVKRPVFAAVLALARDRAFQKTAPSPPTVSAMASMVCRSIIPLQGTPIITT